MTNQDNGGPAFPQITELGDIASTSNGMTLRDYFAAKAMQGDVSRGGYHQPGEHMLRAANNAYAMADAMLEARKLTTTANCLNWQIGRKV